MNGDGLVESRSWESDDQAVSSTYLTRRYTVRMANGPVPENIAVINIIPDVLGHMADKNFAIMIEKVIADKKSDFGININDYNFKTSNSDEAKK